jgi:hypothetical protein
MLIKYGTLPQKSEFSDHQEYTIYFQKIKLFMKGDGFGLGSPLTKDAKYDIFPMIKSCDEDLCALQDTQRGACLVQWLCTPARLHTTSELPVGNSRSGAPVKASMSDSASCNQGGTVEYFVSHP